MTRSQFNIFLPLYVIKCKQQHGYACTDVLGYEHFFLFREEIISNFLESIYQMNDSGVGFFSLTAILVIFSVFAIFK